MILSIIITIKIQICSDIEKILSQIISTRELQMKTLIEYGELKLVSILAKIQVLKLKGSQMTLGLSEALLVVKT